MCISLQQVDLLKISKMSSWSAALKTNMCLGIQQEYKYTSRLKELEAKIQQEDGLWEAINSTLDLWKSK